MSRGDIAVQLATRGWPIFPCKPNSKAPATRSGFYAATTDLVDVRRYWRNIDYNIGLYTGKANLVVIDLDLKPEHGLPGISVWLEMCAGHGYDEWEQSYNVNSPGGGLHIYFTVPDGFWYPPSTSTSGRIGDNIDVRSSGSYVLVAGSVIDGVEYEHWGGDEPLPLPDWLGVMIDRPPPDVEWMNRQHDRDVRSDPAGWSRAFLGIIGRFETEATANVDRNSYFYWAVRAVGDHFWNDDFKEACVADLRDVARGLGLGDREIQDSERSARRRW